MDRDYTTELKSLSERMSIHDRTAIKQGLIDYKEVFDRMDTLYIMYHYLNERDGRGIINNAPKGIRILYAKLANCLIGIIRLLQAGHEGPAAMLLRALFETYVNLMVILKENVQERSQLFEDYLFIERARLTMIPKEMQTNNMLQFQKVRANYHKDNPRSWCWKVVPSKDKDKEGYPRNPSFGELCKHVGRNKGSKIVYGHLSGAIHTGPSYEKWLNNKDGEMEMGSLFRPGIEKTANLTIAYAGDALAHVIKYLNPDDEERLINCIVSLVPQNESIQQQGE
jgi:hypothetical protein